MTITVCRDCQERHTACWGSCPKYQKARAELDKFKADKASEFKHNEAVGAVQYHGLEKNKKRRKKCHLKT